MKHFMRVLGIVAILLMTSGMAGAEVITAWEWIYFNEGIQGQDPLTDLELHAEATTGEWESILNNTVVRNHSSMNASFGVWNEDDVAYTHRFDTIWLSSKPSEGTVLSAELEITAYGAQSNACDWVTIEGTNIGILDTGAFNETKTTTLTISDPGVLQALVSGDMFSIDIYKDRDLTTPTDKINITASKMTITYDTNPVPLPAAAILLGTGLVCLLGVRRKR